LKSLKDWFPLPEKEQFPPEYIQQSGAIVIRADEEHYTLGLTRDSLLLRKQLQNHLPGKTLSFQLIDGRELSIYLADRFSIGPSTEKESARDGLDLDKLEGDAPTINLVNSLILEAVNRGASDIHIEAFSKEVLVRFRLDGALKKVRSIGRDHFNSLSSRIKIMANLNIMERRLPQDGRISVETAGETIDLRVSIVPIAREGESIVLRLLNRSENARRLKDMGFSQYQLSQLKELSRHPHGLILVTGPTGSGKTTTLNGMLKEMAHEEKKIITIEDPIEFIIDGIDQIQTHTDIGLTFSTLLRRVLRQDPNIIMVGEIRDGETADLAVRAALTGHLVLSTLHTNDALSVIPRLKDMGVESYLLAAVLKGALAQRLVRRLCPRCKSPGAVESSEAALFQAQGLDAPSHLYHSTGCDDCLNTGFKGRLAVGEIFLSNPQLEECISKDFELSQIKEILKQQGFRSLMHQGLDLVRSGETTLKEVEGAIYL